MGTIQLKKQNRKLGSKGQGKSRHRQAAMNRKEGLIQSPGRCWLRPVKHEEQTRAGNSGREWIKRHLFMLLETYRGVTTNDSYMKAEITFLHFLHHRSGKLSFLLFACFVSFCFLNHPHPWQYCLCRQYQWEATVRKSDFSDSGSTVSLTWTSAFQHAPKCRPPDSPEELWGW